MDAYRQGEQFIVQFDLPGVDPASIDIGVEHNVLTVRAERTPTIGDGVEVQLAERPSGVYSRQLFLGEALDTGSAYAPTEDPQDVQSGRD